jgi:predicted permease
VSTPTKFLATVLLIVAATAAGYVARRRGLLPEHWARWLMTGVIVLGYSPVSFLSVWQIRPQAADAWLPVLGALQLLLMAGVGLAVGRLVGRDRQEAGLMSMVSAVGNTGFTMGGFVIYLLYGETGLGLGSIYALMWHPMMVLVLYPIGRHFAGRHEGGLAKLMLRSVLDWRSIGLPITLAGLTLALLGVPRPQAVATWHVVDVIICLVLPTAYFSIGLRLHVSAMGSLKRLIASLAALRFLVCPALAAGLAALTLLTPWPLTGISRNVLLINSCVPTAITAVAVANMFHLKPREASALFVTNTLTYLAAILPLAVWVFGR